MKPRIVVVEAPTDADYEAVRAQLAAFNAPFLGPRSEERVAVLLEDEAGGRVGGLAGVVLCDWLYVDLVVVPEAWRGHDLGTALMERAEALARARGCRGMWLTTFTFQARGFYEKLGFATLGSLDGYPAGTDLFFMSKRL